jgi:hypothetical protein
MAARRKTKHKVRRVTNPLPGMGSMSKKRRTKRSTPKRRTVRR